MWVTIARVSFAVQSNVVHRRSVTGAFTRRAFRPRIVPSRNFKSNIVSKSWQHGPAVNRTDRLARNPRGKVNPSFVTKRDRSNEPTGSFHAKAINSPIYYPESTFIKTAKEESVAGAITMARWKGNGIGKKEREREIFSR